MGEETNYFWGVPVRRVRRDETRLLLSWRGTSPGEKPFRFYPMFSSRGRAEEWVRKHGQELLVESPQLVEQLVGDIRKIKRTEIRDEDYVLSDRKGLVTWAELLGGDE
jgi:hypothetical protein